LLPVGTAAMRIRLMQRTRAASGIRSDHATNPFDRREIGLGDSHSAENRGRATIPPSLFDIGIERDAGLWVNWEIR